MPIFLDKGKRKEMSEPSEPSDYTFENHGSVWLVFPQSDEARDWLEEHTDGLWYYNALAVEPRYVDDLVESLRSDGWKVA